MFIKKRDIYKYEFYLCNILKMDVNCRSIPFVTFFLFFCLIVVLCFQNDKRTFHVHLYVSSRSLLNEGNGSLGSDRLGEVRGERHGLRRKYIASYLW